MARSILALALLAPGLLAALAGPSAAQVPTQFPSAMQLAIAPFDAPLAPDGGVGVTTLTIDYSYFSAGALTTASATRIDLAVAENPAWATVTLNPSEVRVPTGAPSGLSSTTAAPQQNVEVRVAVNGEAPAFHPASLRIVATAHPNGAIAPTQADVQTLVQADYDGYLDVVGVPATILIERGGSASLPVTITNHANGATKVTAHMDRPIPGLHMEGLMPFVLDSRATGGTDNAKSAIVTLHADEDFESATAIVRVLGRYALNDAIALEPLELRVRIEASGLASRAANLFGGSNDPARPEGGGLLEAQGAPTAIAGGSLPITLAIVGALAGAWLGARRWRAARGPSG